MLDQNYMKKSSVVFLDGIINFFENICSRTRAYNFLAVRLKSCTQIEYDQMIIPMNLR